MRNPPTARALTTGAAAAMLLILLTGCTVIQQFLEQETVERDADTKEVTKAGQADIFSLQVGDCFNDVDLTNGVSDVPAVPCSDPHDNEIYYLNDMTEPEFPGDDAVGEAADEGCRTQFEAFVGIGYEASSLEFGDFFPSADTWANLNDREVVCMVYDPTGPVTGTLASAAR